MEFMSFLLSPVTLVILLGPTQASLSSCNGTVLCNVVSRSANSSRPCCSHTSSNFPRKLFIRSLSPRYLSPLLPPSAPDPQPPPVFENKTSQNSESSKMMRPHDTTPLPPHQMFSLPVWSNWYFWLFVALLLLIGMAACGYWRRRKIYESSASQTLSHVHGLFPTPTPSDDTPLYGPPLPFLPPAAYPAPPPYSEATRPSYDRLDQRHLYDALISGRTVYDFYDRRHPNAYYDRYFLPDDTSSSETTSLLSYRLQRSCSAHLPRHHNVKKCHDKPPPYSEVAAKPEMYPVVVVKGESGGREGNTITNITSEIKSTKSMTEANSHNPQWLPPYYYSYRSGSISTPEGSQASSVPGYGHHQNVIEWWRGPRGTVSPATLLASCSGIPSPASSSGPLPSEVSSLAPTSPPSPPAPTTPTLPDALQASPSSVNEFRDVLHKINQLPRASSPTSPSRLSSDCHSPGASLSPVPLTPGTSPGSFTRPRSCSRASQTPWRSPSPISSPPPPPPQIRKSKRHLVASLSMEGGSTPNRPQSLALRSSENHQLSSSASTPNLLACWLQSVNHNEAEASLKRSRVHSETVTPLNRSRSNLDASPALSRLTLEAALSGDRIVHRTSGNRLTSGRWWDSEASIHRV